jgi:hypothetical protein
MMNSESFALDRKSDELMKSIKHFDFKNIVKKYRNEHGATEGEASQVLIQLQRWLMLCILYPQKRYPIGAKVDAMWHTFILFTREYKRFCDDVAGFFIHHAPDTSDSSEDVNASTEEAKSKLAVLQSDYKNHFGENPPLGIWPQLEYIKKGNEGCTSCSMPPPCGHCSLWS